MSLLAQTPPMPTFKALYGALAFGAVGLVSLFGLFASADRLKSM
jgi:hypothetical protein